ncbi:hypothetical protein BKM04_16480 [Pseudomonas syringae pv. syringae]|nr:hypothetical protein AO069_06825 [Pseudomonas syringae pv. syringae PD2774]KWS21732.1 hypothetical protein AL062_18255 [Pseudomonas syringae pv. syringae]BBN62684.1 hypothetical protein KUIN1_18740 [Pseudomonas sp. KUIN-1]KWS29484.1 hypothetical protein AL061_00425 [Pseudomonas syringae pv. syringae]POD19126.1 hypothetical protein BKM12_14030 [Pseudomonas syringae pv. syringae]
MIVRLNRTEISHGWTARPCLNARAHIDERTHYSIIQTVIVAQDFLTIGIAQIVVPQHYDRDLCQIRAKYALATGVKAVAINQSEDLVRR